MKKYGYFIILPDDTFKFLWDLYTTLLLLIIFIFTSYWITFTDDNDVGWIVFDSFIDFSFLIDIFVQFFSAYYNQKYILIDNRWVIIFNYLKSWFVIDLVSILPFNFMTGSGGQNYGWMTRLAKLNRLYWLIRLIWLVRMLKAVRDWNKIVRYLNKFLWISAAAERLLFFSIIAILLMHNCACFWVLIAQAEDTYKSWIN